MRSFKTGFAPDFLEAYQAGVMSFKYRGIPCLKSPIDLAIYMSLLWAERPGTIFEIGSKSGGSARFFSDITGAFGLHTRVMSIDVDPPETTDTDRVTFYRGDVLDLKPVFEAHGLLEAPRPWLVIEDSAHTYAGCLAAMRFFSQHLLPGEMLVIEDGVLDDLRLSEPYDGGPNRAIDAFFREDAGVFELALEYTDMFGVNATYNPNGYLRKL